MTTYCNQEQYDAFYGDDHQADLKAGYEAAHAVIMAGPYASLQTDIDDGSVWEGADMWATPDQSRDYVLGLYHRAWQHSDESLATIALDAPATVAWWPEERRATTFGHLVVRVVAETAQHAGHCDIVRELIDGPDGPESYVGPIRAAADTFRDRL